MVVTRAKVTAPYTHITHTHICTHVCAVCPDMPCTSVQYAQICPVPDPCITVIPFSKAEPREE